MSKNKEPVQLCTEKTLSLEPDVQLQAFEIAKAQNVRNVPESNIIDPVHLALVRGKMHKVGGLIRVKFMNGTVKQQQGVKMIAKEWEHFANVKFNFINSGKSDIRVAFKWQNDSGSWSYIGTDCFNISQDRPTMNFGWLDTTFSDKDAYNRVVLHEFGHALGCIHEHQNPDVNIPWNKQAVYDYYMGPPNRWTREQVDSNIFKKYSTTTTQYSNFDRESIMLYSISNSLTIGNYEVKSNKELSAVDKSYMQVVYPLTIKQITPLSLGKMVTTAIGQYMDEDYYSFDITTDSAQKVTIETHGNMDSVMSLMEFNSKRVVAWDDDSGQYRASKIIKALNKGKYLVRIRHYSPTATGTYKMTLKGTTAI